MNNRMIDGNTAALDAHLAREEETQRKRQELRYTARCNLMERYGEQFTMADEFFIDELVSLNNEGKRFARAWDQDDFVEMGDVVATAYDLALRQYIDYNMEAEIDRLITG